MSVLKKIKPSVVHGYRKTVYAIQARPLVSLLIAIILLIAVFSGAHLSQKKEVAETKIDAAKIVKVYSIGESPKATFQAKVEKSGVIKIFAQSSGIVQNISVTEGQKVGRGQQLISLSSNYQGGNAASVQRQIAQTQYQNVLDTYDPQKDLISKQRDVATASADNAQEMRDISAKSNDETKSLIDANQEQLDQLRQQLEVNPNDVTIQASVNQLQGAIDQLRSSQRNLEYQASNDKPPTTLANLQKDITLKQLDIQDKSLAMSKEVSRLQVNLAYINEATMYPASPFAGIVQRVYVHVGQSVNTGTPLAVIASPDTKTTLILSVPEKIAKIIATGEPSELLINGKKVALTPYYVSSQATDGSLYTAFYAVPDDVQLSLTDSEFLPINVPVDKAAVTAANPFVPIDAVYQTQEKAFVLVSQKGTAVTRTIILGEVFGDYVQVLSGLHSGDQIILDRTVVAGDRVKLN